MKRLVVLLALAGGPACAQGTFPGTIAGPWTAYTPAPACGTATITTNAARAQTVGKTTTLQLDMTITALGTCTNTFTFTLPNTANSGGGLVGRTSVGSTLNCFVTTSSSSAGCTVSANLAATNTVVLSGVYESQ